MPTCAIAPAIESPLIERLEWLTDVLPSRNGKEQRQRQRNLPRRRMDFAFAVGSDTDRARVENFITGNHGSVVGLPLWQDQARLDTPLSAGAVTIPLSTVNRAYVVGGQAAILNGLDVETVTIGAVSSNSLTVSALLANWPAGSMIAPVINARMDARITTSNPWLSVLRGRIQFQGETGADIAAASETADYLGYPVKHPDASWALDGNTDYSRLLSTFDPMVGNRAVYDNAGLEFAERQYRIALADRAALAGYYAWLSARAGRQNPFWLSSGQKDFTPVASIGSGGTAWQVANTGYAALGAPPVGRRDIVIQTLSGQTYTRRIVSAGVIDASTEQIVLSSALGVSLSPSDVASVSFLRLSRLANDSIEIAHHWDGVAESRLSVHALRDDL